VQEFLEEVSKDFEIIVFTASDQDYANKVLDVVDKRGKAYIIAGKYISHRLYRHDCIITSNS
jgi:CTD small phosphatase-like protein 2